MTEFLLPFLGRMHPVLVHLPIGILVFGILLCFFPQNGKNPLLPSIRLAFLIGGIAALAAGLSGFLQYQFEGFAWEDVQLHLIGGVITAVGSFGMYALVKNTEVLSTKIRVFAAVLGLILGITGHWGGNLTHGEDYFTEVLPADLQSLLGTEIQPEKGPQLTEETWENAQLYAEVIQPILNKNCKSCHNPRNRKGELDLSSLAAMRKGGEEGMVLTAGDAAHSMLFARLLLPKEDEKHMPPAEKNQPSKKEIALIERWIKSGAKESGTLAAAGISKKQIERFILKNEIPFYPISELAPLAVDSLADLKEAGLFAEAVESGSGLLKVTCINLPTFQDSDWKILASVQSRIAYLDLSGTQVTDALVSQLEALPNLTVLKLNSTGIAGNSLNNLAQIKNLKLLYLNKTGVKISQLQALASSKSLEKVFAFDTPASRELATAGKASFSFILEAGTYSLPKLATDSKVY
ncbi:MAG: hypothetical protein O2829_10985 [Bacteroidetes bacterium]|nr:hypothetical protein [Bacteroidota bacterium]